MKTQRTLWKEFLPLSLSDVVMALSDPLTTMTVSRLPGSHVSLAALGVAKPLAILFESPAIMLLHASNALAGTKSALWRFMVVLTSLLTIGLALLCVPLVFEFIGTRVFALEGEWLTTAHTTLLFFAAWPFASGWRRYYQGLLIHAGRSRDVAHSSVLRLLATASVLAIGYALGARGWLVGASALLAGIITEAVVVTAYAFYRDVLHLHRPSAVQSELNTLGDMWRYYRPLAWSMVIVWGSRALLVVAVAHAVDSKTALAAWPVAWGIIVLISNATRMVQQVVIRNHHAEPRSSLGLFAFSVGVIASSLLLFLSVVPIGRWCVGFFVGGDVSLVERLIPVLLLCSPVPVVVALQNALQGLLVGTHRTHCVQKGSWVGAILLLLAVTVCIKSGWPGVYAAGTAVVIASIGELAYLSVITMGRVEGFFMALPSKRVR